MSFQIIHETTSPNSYAFGLTASGTTQANAYSVPGRRSVFTTVAAGTACVMSMPAGASEHVIVNQGLNTLTVYPPGGWSFNNGVVNASTTIAVGTSLTFVGGDPNESSWWTRT